MLSLKNFGDEDIRIITCRGSLDKLGGALLVQEVRKKTRVSYVLSMEGVGKMTTEGINSLQSCREILGSSNLLIIAGLSESISQIIRENQLPIILVKNQKTGLEILQRRLKL
ncbi:MAG: hypothetical protein WCV85_04260 [Patescibacteria group bacterium]